MLLLLIIWNWFLDTGGKLFYDATILRNNIFFIFRMLDEKRIFVAQSANKLRNGLSKIDDTREKVFYIIF